MKRTIIILLTALLGLTSTLAQIPAGYYSSAAGKKDAALLQALHNCIDGHTVINYSALEDYYEAIDFRADGTLWDIYSTCTFTMAEANKAQKDFCDGWNKEHTVPQSWFNEGSPMKSDLFHVLPTDARVNNLRSNNPYGETASRNDKVSQGAPYALGHLGTSSFEGFSGVGTVYEPDDKYKGDIARIYFYMVARYIDKALNASSGAKMFTYSGGTTGLTDYSVALLMKWHRQDPVSQKEINRNDSVYKVQKNRNPFVDYPYLAEYIWGNKKGTNLDFNTIISAYDPTFIPDQSDGTGSTTYQKFGVNWSVNGEIIMVDSVYENQSPHLPGGVQSCSEDKMIIGYTTAPIEGSTDNVPVPLYEKDDDFPVVTADITYYAVFAHAEQQEGEGSVTATASFTDNDGYKRGNKVSSAYAGKVNITFAGGNTATTYYSELRCYANSTVTLNGAVISRVEFVAGTNDKKNALTANIGAMADPVWTGNATEVTFTVGGDSGYRGLSAIKVTYSDQTSLQVLSNYTTTCNNAPSAIVPTLTSATPTVHKLLIGGQLYLRVDDTLYSIMGQKIE